eukprot:TRINITY_DN7789_c0_g1_i1.p1 TRINITY_DN7789_c0_g1~~TRINITY_DN7789_c0_g1_i1.p1  ORF type:complete len:631 (-),score=114.55 TRINITY_DN7789_c0_g1_i1:66-1958(-)
MAVVSLLVACFAATALGQHRPAIRDLVAREDSGNTDAQCVDDHESASLIFRLHKCVDVRSHSQDFCAVQVRCAGEKMILNACSHFGIRYGSACVKTCGFCGTSKFLVPLVLAGSNEYERERPGRKGRPPPHGGHGGPDVGWFFHELGEAAGYMCFGLVIAVCMFIFWRNRRGQRLAIPSGVLGHILESSADAHIALVSQQIGDQSGVAAGRKTVAAGSGSAGSGGGSSSARQLRQVSAPDEENASEDEEDGLAALAGRRQGLHDCGSRNEFSSGSLVETFSMLTEDIFNKSKMFGIMKLGVYEHWVIKREDVTFTQENVTVGRGSFGEVVHGWLYGGTEVALKKAVSVNREQGLLALANEIRLLRRIRHANVVLFHGVLVASDCLSISMVLEWVDGKDYGTYVRSIRAASTPGHETKLLVDVARGMQYLHAQRPAILHRDLKPSNILVETIVQPPRAKIADFGLSVMWNASGRGQRVGTVAYMAPEVMRSEPYSMGADVFSFGCVVLFTVTSRHPNTVLLEKLTSGALEVEEDRPDLKILKGLAQACLKELPQERPPFFDVLQWLLKQEMRVGAAPRSAEGSPTYSRERTVELTKLTNEPQKMAQAPQPDSDCSTPSDAPAFAGSLGGTP